MTTIDDLANAQSRGPDPLEAAEQLAALLDLPSVGVHIRGARVTGRGSRAAIQIELSNDEELEFDSARDFVRPQNLVCEVAATTGACPNLKQPQAVRALALVRALAEHTRSITADDIARSWGVDYLQASDILDCDIEEQGERWAAFKHLESVNPMARRAQDGGTLASRGVILRHRDESLLVRTGWFREYVKQECDHTVSAPQIHQRMQRVGWGLRGKDGRIKATSPTHGQRGAQGESLVWTFYEIPGDWS